ncbi:hypothetical protein GDO81_020543 [Engystomops pustulosus]|uniref:L27 domain-containing protein n=1 Tax=Engystomops pustulosus TaxID=76066 RepID=A0AAV6Z891_ENGPU|nr:hypothetical protein GDO81_020543 [Engystomops pustulosus]
MPVRMHTASPRLVQPPPPPPPPPQWGTPGHVTAGVKMAALSEPLGLERDVSRAIELLERLQRSGEVPPQKLQALQRVLQSKFCSAIREVEKDIAPKLKNGERVYKEVYFKEKLYVQYVLVKG